MALVGFSDWPLPSATTKCFASDGQTAPLKVLDNGVSHFEITCYGDTAAVFLFLYETLNRYDV